MPRMRDKHTDKMAVPRMGDKHTGRMAVARVRLFYLMGWKRLAGQRFLVRVAKVLWWG